MVHVFLFLTKNMTENLMIQFKLIDQLISRYFAKYLDTTHTDVFVFRCVSWTQTHLCVPCIERPFISNQKVWHQLTNLSAHWEIKTGANSGNLMDLLWIMTLNNFITHKSYHCVDCVPNPWLDIATWLHF